MKFERERCICDKKRKKEKRKRKKIGEKRVGGSTRGAGAGL